MCYGLNGSVAACTQTVAVFALLCATLASAEPDRALIEATRPSVLKLHVTTFHGEPATGTAVTIAPEIVVTACHVTKDAIGVQVLTQDRTLEVTSQLRDTEHDLCLLRVKGLTAPPVKISSAKELREAAAITAFGYPYGQDIEIRMGIVQRLHSYDGSRVIQSSTPFYFGDSGGGLFNNRGELVGIMSFMLGNDNPANFAMPTDWLPHAYSDAASYTRIAPVDAKRPFFMKVFNDLPYFLKAVKFERDRKWADLRHLSDEWTAREPSNADAWYARGAAFAELGDSLEAYHAYQRAAALDSQCGLAWLRLGLLYVGRGQLGDLDRVLHLLAGIDQPLVLPLATENGGER